MDQKISMIVAENQQLDKALEKLPGMRDAIAAQAAQSAEKVTHTAELQRLNTHQAQEITHQAQQITREAKQLTDKKNSRTKERQDHFREIKPSPAKSQIWSSR
jgi:hypothetical protein